MSNYSINNLLGKYSVKCLFDIFSIDSKEIKLVGGCVRDALLGIDTKDIDIAANLYPEKIISILNAHDIKYENYALKYGSITALIEGQKFQITTLREDVQQTGRSTNINYTNDWQKDAKRRDLSINAIYLSQDGSITDFFNGQKHLKENKLQFIVNIEESIKQDYLRIFRYYRFLGLFKNPHLSEAYEQILKKYCIESFKYLSNEILRQEILKIFRNPFPLNSFFYNIANKEKRFWINQINKHFIESKYELGLKKCINKIDTLIK